MGVLARAKPVAAGGCLLRLVTPELEPRSRTDFSALGATALLVHPDERQQAGHATVSLSAAEVPGDAAAKRRRLEREPCPLGTGTWWTELTPEPAAAPPRGIKLAACAIPLDQHNRVLLTRRPRTMRTFPGCWVLPGGAVDPGEATQAAAERELAEETGLTPTGLDPTPLAMWERCDPHVLYRRCCLHFAHSVWLV